MPPATQRNARNLKPDILRNEIVEYVDQMDRLESGGDGTHASALSEFPLVNIDDPDEEWWTMHGARSSMPAAAYGSESPIGTLDTPDKDSHEVFAYKRKYRPDKGAETEFSSTPFSLYSRAATVLRMEIYLRREQIVWLGDRNIDGLTGRFGNEPHADIAAEGHVIDPAAAWSDQTAATPHDDLSSAAFNIVNNGMFGTSGQTTLYLSPGMLRDLKRSQDFEQRVSGVRVQSLNSSDIAELVDEDIGQIRRVVVNLPRQDASGNFLDEAGNIVDDVDDAAMDNVLEPYDPGLGRKVRNAIIARPGAGSAYIPWFSDRLLERASQAPDPGSFSIDGQNGFFTQVWNEHDPIMPNFKAAQEIGFKLLRPKNFSIVHDI